MSSCNKETRFSNREWRETIPTAKKNIITFLLLKRGFKVKWSMNGSDIIVIHDIPQSLINYNNSMKLRQIQVLINKLQNGLVNGLDQFQNQNILVNYIIYCSQKFSTYLAYNKIQSIGVLFSFFPMCKFFSKNYITSAAENSLVSRTNLFNSLIIYLLTYRFVYKWKKLTRW